MWIAALSCHNDNNVSFKQKTYRKCTTSDTAYEVLDMKKLVLFFLSTTGLFAYEEKPLPELTTTLKTYTEQVQKSSRTDHEVWCALATPLCDALTNPHNNKPYDSPPSLSPEKKELLELLTAYVSQQKTLDQSAVNAVASLAALYAQPRRDGKYSARAHSAQAIADRVNQSRTQREHVRRASPQERSVRRFQHEEKVKRKHLRLQERIAQNKKRKHNNATFKREQRRLALENMQRLEERKKIWRAKKQQEYEAQLKAQREREEQERKQRERDNRERVRQELLSGK